MLNEYEADQYEYLEESNEILRSLVEIYKDLLGIAERKAERKDDSTVKTNKHNSYFESQLAEAKLRISTRESKYAAKCSAYKALTNKYEALEQDNQAIKKRVSEHSKLERWYTDANKHANEYACSLIDTVRLQQIELSKRRCPLLTIWHFLKNLFTSSTKSTDAMHCVSTPTNSTPTA